MNRIPEEAADLFHEGTRRMAEGDAEGAEGIFRRALALAPEVAEIHANLALLLERGGRLAVAETHYRRALAADPQQAQILLNLGALLERQQRPAEAEALFRQALALEPDSPAGWSNLGVALADMKREEEAEQCHRTAMGIDPAYRKAPFNLAYLLLRQGRLEEGWRCLEARDSFALLERQLAFPRWRGEPLQGRSLLIGFELGHGDMIQFCRYAALVRRRGAARIAILCHPA